MFHTKNILNRIMGLSFLASLGFVVLLSLAHTDRALAADAPDLGMAATFGILSSTYTNTVAGTTINGDLGYTTGPAVVPTVNGTTHVARCYIFPSRDRSSHRLGDSEWSSLSISRLWCG